MGSSKRYKGVRYIANALRKYKGKRYSNYNDALSKARELKVLLDSSGHRVLLKNIFPLVCKPKRLCVPELDSKLLELSYYFELSDYPTYISRVTNEVFFLSKLFPSGLNEIQGGSFPVYEDTFRFYVNYINSIKGKTDESEKRYESEWMVRCTLPVYNRSRKRWESEIISTDGTGDRFDYGFNRDKPESPSDGLVLSGVEKEDVKLKVSDSDLPSSKEEKIKDSESLKLESQAELLRQENITTALKLFGEGKLTKLEFKELMQQIKRK